MTLSIQQQKAKLFKKILLSKHPGSPDYMTSLNTLIASFNQDITRDLAWSVFAPSLLTSTEIPAFRPELTEMRIEWLQAFDARHHDLKPHYRLGRYFESLWTCFFQQDQQYELMAQNIAIEKHGKTLGEIDFIVLDHETGHFLHIEVAVKFYLYHQHLLHPQTNTLPINDNSHWLGPNSKDNLERKWQHLTQHQCQLSRQAEAIHALEKLGVDCTKLDRSLCLKGYVFAPFNTNISPRLFNIENNQYHYFTIAAFENTDWSNVLLGIIPKQCWLTRIHTREAITPLHYHEIIHYVRQANAPIMIAELARNNHQLLEIKRYFVIPASWP